MILSSASSFWTYPRCLKHRYSLAVFRTPIEEIANEVVLIQSVLKGGRLCDTLYSVGLDLVADEVVLVVIELNGVLRQGEYQRASFSLFLGVLGLRCWCS